MTGHSFSTPVWEGGQWVVPAVAEVRAAARANGPEDRPRDASGQWDRIDWRAQEEQVRRLRQRIFTAAQEQDWPRVRNLQKLMLRSRANADFRTGTSAPGSGEFEVERASAPPGDGGVGGEVGVAEDG